MKINLNKIRMNVVKTDSIGVVNSETLFEFSQNDNIVSAQYSGGGISEGYLIGKIDKNNLEFRYVQLQNDGKLSGGQSQCEINILEDGRLQLIENFQWETSPGAGTNIFEEIKK